MDGGGDAPIDFSCPRCGNAATARYYGPCPSCRRKLVDSQGGLGREVEAQRFEPVVHVVPNQVATKE